MLLSDVQMSLSSPINDHDLKVHTDSLQKADPSHPVSPRPSADSTTSAKSLDPPPGWSNDQEFMDEFCCPDDDEDLKSILEDYYHLPDAQFICARLPSTGYVMYLFQSGSKYYVWNDMTSELGMIEEPQRLEDIYAVISKSGGYLGGLKMKV